MNCLEMGLFGINEHSFVFNYPFGMQIQERVYTSSSKGYRFGFNGMERDDELKGDGNSLDFGARIYDSRLGRWCSRDPFEASHANLSGYIFVNNCPILFIDVAGNDFHISAISSQAQKDAFKKIIEDRFSGAVSINFEKSVYVESSSYVDENGQTQIVSIPHDNLKVTMTFDITAIESKIKSENKKASADEITKLTNEYVAEIKSDPAFKNLDDIFNSQKNQTVWNIQLLQAKDIIIADYGAGVINAKNIMNARSLGFSMLYHEVIEQAAKAQGLQLEGLVEGIGTNKGYPSAHWLALEKQGEEMGGVMALNTMIGGMHKTVLYQPGYNKQGKLKCYHTTTYIIEVDQNDNIINAAEIDETEISVAEYNTAISDYKSALNKAHGSSQTNDE